MISTTGSKESPWKLKTPPNTSEYEMYKDIRLGQEVIVCVVGQTTLLYDARCIADLHLMLIAHEGWMDLGGADEQKDAREGTVEAWGQSAGNPIGGWYGLKKRASRPFWRLSPSFNGSPRPGRINAWGKKQQDEGQVS